MRDHDHHGDRALIEGTVPDAVVLATGARSRRPRIEGAEEAVLEGIKAGCAW